MRKKKKKDFTWLWILLPFLILIIIGFGFCTFKPTLPDKDNATEQEEIVECPAEILLGQDCEDKENCCEEGTSCAKEWWDWECKYNYPDCPYPPMDWSLEEQNLTYDAVSGEIVVWEHWLPFVDALDDKGYKVDIEQCMENHEEFRDFCCRCPDGTSTRFVYDEAQGLNYMWCFNNPRG